MVKDPSCPITLKGAFDYVVSTCRKLMLPHNDKGTAGLGRSDLTMD